MTSFKFLLKLYKVYFQQFYLVYCLQYYDRILYYSLSSLFPNVNCLYDVQIQYKLAFTASRPVNITKYTGKDKELYSVLYTDSHKLNFHMQFYSKI